MNVAFAIVIVQMIVSKMNVAFGVVMELMRIQMVCVMMLMTV